MGQPQSLPLTQPQHSNMSSFTADPAAPAYLWVMADPGEAATTEGSSIRSSDRAADQSLTLLVAAEFNEWYDNEHVPLRMEQ